jgi:peptidoglycan/LPS O-acetylase OafA/YrhL
MSSVRAPSPADAPASARAPSPAVAPPPGNPRFALFDSLRGIAVMAILAYHVASITGQINSHVSGDFVAVLGNEALILFFVISGFLLYRPYAAAYASGRARPNAWRYARRRVLRIVPAYWVALTLLAIYPGITGVFSGDWWRYYFFLQAYSSRTLAHGILPAWSLSVEVSYYALLPVWAILVRALARRLGGGPRLAAELGPLALLAALGVGIQVAASRLAVTSLLATTLLGECVWLALGMSLAVASAWTDDRDRADSLPSAARLVREHPGLCWIGALACLIGATAVLHPGGLFNIILSLQQVQPLARTLGGIVLSGGLAVLLVLPAVWGEGRGGIPRRILAWRPLMGLGLVSYGVYLYHLTVSELLGDASDPQHFSASGLGLTTRITHLTTPVLYVLALAVTTTVAALSYRFVELPFLRRKEPSAPRVR